MIYTRMVQHYPCSYREVIRFYVPEWFSHVEATINREKRVTGCRNGRVKSTCALWTMAYGKSSVIQVHRLCRRHRPLLCGYCQSPGSASLP